MATGGDLGNFLSILYHTYAELSTEQEIVWLMGFWIDDFCTVAVQTQILNDFLIKLIMIQVFSLILASLTIVENFTILILSDHFTTRYYVISKKMLRIK